jgi:hypothetical protein
MGSLFSKPKIPQTKDESALEEDRKKARNSRALLFKTEGGVSGDPLQEGQVSTRGNLFGN